LCFEGARLHRLRKKSILYAQPLKGASQFKELTASLKRCPDTKLEFFSNLLSRSNRSDPTEACGQNGLPRKIADDGICQARPRSCCGMLGKERWSRARPTL